MIELSEPLFDLAGRKRYKVIRTGTRKQPERVLMAATVVGDEVHVDTYRLPPLHPADLEKLGKVLNQIAKNARHHQK